MDTLPTDRPIWTLTLENLEAVAVRFWADRGYTCPTPVQVYRVSDISGAHAWGDMPGNRVWLSDYLLDELEKGNAVTKLDARCWLCMNYIHERGHNAGLPHDVGYKIMHMGPGLAERFGPCLAWAHRNREARTSRNRKRRHHRRFRHGKGGRK